MKINFKMILNLLVLIFILHMATMFDVEHFGELLDRAEEYVRMVVWAFLNRINLKYLFFLINNIKNC